MANQPHVAIVGASGAVGEEMLVCLEERNFELSELTLLASARSAGKTVKFRGQDIVIKELTVDSFVGIDIALFSAGGGISEEFGPIAAAAGAVVIDNSSAFRMDPEVPLVVPEINPSAAKNHPKNIIANPNCSTIITLMGLAPLHREFGLTGIIASTYQAVSGSGAQGIIELENQIKAVVAGEAIEKKVYPHQIVHNVIPHSHSISATAIFKDKPSVEAARAAFDDVPGVKVADDPAKAFYPVPLDTTGKDDCLVGRIREDQVLPNALSLWIVGDQVRKGAALNAVQIAELL